MRFLNEKPKLLDVEEFILFFFFERERESFPTGLVFTIVEEKHLCTLTIFIIFTWGVFGAVNGCQRVPLGAVVDGGQSVYYHTSSLYSGGGLYNPESTGATL